MKSPLYCSICGVELTHRRKAVPGKGHIFNLVDPHECEGFAIKANEGGNPTVLDVIEGLKDIGRTHVISDGKNEEGRYAGPGDLRDDKSKVTSTAPGGLLRSMRDLPPSENGSEEID